MIEATPASNFEYLVKLGAATTKDHIIKPNGDHARGSFTKYKLYRHPRQTLRIAQAIAKDFGAEEIDAVIGPGNGGNVLAVLVALELGKLRGKKISSLYTESCSHDNLILRDKSNQDLIKGKKVLVVDDVLNSGQSIRSLTAYVQGLSAHIAGVGVICNRNALTRKNLGVKKLYSFVIMNDEKNSYLPQSCPMCSAGVPINKKFGKDS